MKLNSQLTQEQRYQIYILMKAGYNKTEIADLIGVYQSTITREVKRNSRLRGYQPQQAHRFYQQRRDQKALLRLKIQHGS